MYKEIEKFLAFLRKETAKPLIEETKDKENGFEIKSYADFAPKEYDCEIAKIFAESSDVLDVIKKIYNQEYFELQHPLIKGVTSRAVRIYKYHNENNYFGLFMIDKDNKYPWVLISYEPLACIATPQGFFSADIFGKNTFVNVAGDLWAKRILKNSLANELKKVSATDIVYKDIKFSTSIATTRPWHLFIDMLPIAMACGIKTIANEKLFFKPKNFKLSSDINRLKIPIRYTYSGRYSLNFQDYVIKDSLEDKLHLMDEIRKQKYDLVIWFGIPGERRYWLEQYEGIPQILKNLSKYFHRIKIYIDGMTAYEGEYIKVENNIAVFENIKKEIYKLKLNIDIESLAGYDYRTKICHGYMCDLYIGDLGTTPMVPSIILKKPSVLLVYSEVQKVFTNAVDYYNADNIVYTEDQFLHSIITPGAFSCNLHLPWEHVYNLAAQMLEKIKNIKMHRLDVPPVEILVLRAKVNALSAEINRLKAGNATSMSATERIQNHLSYKLGRLMIENSRSIFGWLKMPFSIIGTIKEHKLLTKLTNKITKLPKIETLPDYKEALKYKNHMSYKLGEAFLKINKNWHKGGPIWFICEAIKIKSKKKA